MFCFYQSVVGMQLKVRSVESFSHSQIEELVFIKVSNLFIFTNKMYYVFTLTLSLILWYDWQMTSYINFICNQNSYTQQYNKVNVSYVFSYKSSWLDLDFLKTSPCIWEATVKSIPDGGRQHFPVVNIYSIKNEILQSI